MIKPPGEASTPVVFRRNHTSREGRVMIPTQRAGRRRGITLTEILISIMILGDRPDLAGHALPDRPAPAPRGPAADAIGLPRRVGRGRRGGPRAAQDQARLLMPICSTPIPPNNFNRLVLIPPSTGGYYDPLIQDRRPTSLDPFVTTHPPPCAFGGAPRRPPAATACHSPTTRSGGGRPTTPTAAFTSTTRTTRTTTDPA